MGVLPRPAVVIANVDADHFLAINVRRYGFGYVAYCFAVLLVPIMVQFAKPLRSLAAFLEAAHPISRAITHRSSPVRRKASFD